MDEVKRHQKIIVQRHAIAVQKIKGIAATHLRIKVNTNDLGEPSALPVTPRGEIGQVVAASKWYISQCAVVFFLNGFVNGAFVPA